MERKSSIAQLKRRFAVEIRSVERGTIIGVKRGGRLVARLMSQREYRKLLAKQPR